MPLSAKIRNKFRALIQSWGPTSAKRTLWNKEFASGHWGYIDHTPKDCIYGFLERYAQRGSILDLGCGAGNTGTELSQDAYTYYLGVDISDVAVEKAGVRAKACGRSSNAYQQGDIETFSPDRTFDVILFRESLFYIPLSKITRTLGRYSKFLSPHGVFILRMYDRVRCEPILLEVAASFKIVESFCPDGTTTIVSVFMPKG